MKWLVVLLAWGALGQDKVSTGDKIAGATTDAGKFAGAASRDAGGQIRNGPSVAGGTRGDAGGKVTGATPGAAMGESLAKQRAAMAVQREAARKQAERLPLAPLIHHDMEPAEPECDPREDAAVNPIIESAAKANELAPELLRAVMRQESQFYPCAVSEKGAQGLMQLIPTTSEQFSVREVFDPKQNVEAGAKFLKQLFDKYKGNLSIALAAYNAGRQPWMRRKASRISRRRATTSMRSSKFWPRRSTTARRRLDIIPVALTNCSDHGMTLPSWGFAQIRDLISN